MTSRDEPIWTAEFSSAHDGWCVFSYDLAGKKFHEGPYDVDWKANMRKGVLARQWREQAATSLPPAQEPT